MNTEPISLSPGQLRALNDFAAGHENHVAVEDGPFDAAYKTFRLLDAEGKEVRQLIVTYNGALPRKEGVPPEWERDEPAGEA
jgi:hypothetical protein